MNVALGDASRNAQRVTDTFTNIGQTIDSAITQNLEAAFSGQQVQSWGGIAKSIFAQVKAELISLTVIRPAIGSCISLADTAQEASQFGENQ
jgi:hypothetical protein